VSLAATAVPAEKKYVLLAGAGISKDAGLPTSWDLMLATAELLRAGEAGSGGEDLEAWFLQSQYAKISYAELIGNLFPTAVEQQNFIREKLRANEPAEAHKLIAELARRGIIRCAITTNFDSLMEKSIESAGLTVQVIANDDDLKNSEPLIQCKSFRVYKPHGTMGVGRIRNTPADLQQLSTEMEAELSRVLSEHGLLVLGYSGRDEGMRRVFRLGRNGHYPVFWVNPSEPVSEVKECFSPATFGFIPCEGASQFLKGLFLVYERLAAVVPVLGLSGAAADAIDAVQSQRKDVAARLRRFMESLAEELSVLKPNLITGKEDDLLVEALGKSSRLITEYGRVATAMAETANEEAAVAMFQGLSGVLEGYNLRRGYAGQYLTTQFDFDKFIGHELCVMLFQVMIRERRWELIGRLFDEGIYVENAHSSGPEVVDYEYISMHVGLLDHRGERLGLRPLLEHAKLLAERHSSGELGRLFPLDDFIDADFFLFLASRNRSSSMVMAREWRPWSILRMSRVPKFLHEATQARYATGLAQVLRAAEMDALRAIVRERIKAIGEFFGRGLGPYVFEQFDPNKIGTR